MSSDRPSAPADTNEPAESGPTGARPRFRPGRALLRRGRQAKAHAKSLAPRNVRHLRRQLQVYAQRLGWLARDALRHFPGHLCFAAALHAMGVLTGGAMIGTIIAYVRHLEQGEPLHLGAITLPVMGGSTAAVFASIIALTGIASAAMVYFGEWSIARLAMRYQRECHRRLFRIVSDPAYRGWASLVSGPADQAVKRLSGVKVRITALTVRRMVRGVMPVCMLLLAAGALIVTNWRLTLLLAPLGAIYAAPLYLINRGAAKAHRAHRTEAPRLKKSTDQRLKTVLRSRAATDDKLDSASALLDSDQYDHAGMLFFKRKLIGTQVQFLNTTLFVIAIVVLFTYAAIQSGTPDWSWARLLLYLLALRFAVRGLQQTTATFARLSRFLPEYRDYIEFVGNAEAMRRRRAAGAHDRAELPETLTIQCRGLDEVESARRLKLRRPGPLWVLVPWKPIEVDLDTVIVHLEHRTRDVHDLMSVSCCHAHGTAAHDATDQRLARDRVEPDTQTLRTAYDRLGVLEELTPWLEARRHSGDANTASVSQADAPDTGELSPEAAWAREAACIFDRWELVCLDADSLRKLDPTFLEALAALLSDRHVVLVGNDVALPEKIACPRWSESEQARVLAYNDERMIGGGDVPWLHAHAETIQQWLQYQSESAEVVDEDMELDLMT